MRRFDPVVELYALNDWRDISSKVRYDNGNGIRVSTGTRELSTNVASSCTMTLDNRTGDFSPRNAMGAYYRLRRNTPIRVGTRIARDLYTSRTASNGWGSTTQGVPAVWAWTVLGTASDFAVTAGVGTHSLSSSTSRITYLSSVDMANVELRATFQLPFADVLGGSIAINLLFRGGGGGFYRAQIVVTSTETVTVQWFDIGAIALGSPVTVAGLTNTGQQIRVAAHMDGETGRVKVWPASSPEPYDWTLEQDRIGVANSAPLHGWVGIETFKAAGNTNGTFSVSYTNFELINRIFCGEVSEWPPKMDISGNDVTTSIEASGVLRRYRAGGKTLRSAAFRSLSKSSDLVAYWSCEDGSTSNEFASANPNWPSMAILSGDPRRASDSTFAASQPLPVVSNSVWEGLVNGYTVPSPAVIQLRWLMDINVDNGEPPNNATIIRLKNTGSAYFYIVRYVTGGSLLLEVQDYFGNIIDSDAIAVETRWVGARGSLKLTQSGGNVNWTVSIADVDLQTVQSVSGSTAGQTIGMLGGVAVGSDANLNDVTIGHITAQVSASNPLDYAQELYAWQGETAPNRGYRVLHTEEGLPFQREGDYSRTPTMGVQPIASPLDFLDQTAEVNQGLVWEPHFHAGIGYITFLAMSNRDPRLTLDYDQRQLFGDLPIVDDDKYTANVVTVEKGNTSNSVGSKVTRTQTTGPLSALDPEDGGVGPYETPDQINVNTLWEAQNLAGLKLMRGTLDEPRLPAVTVFAHAQQIYSSVPMLHAALDVREGSFVEVRNIPVQLASDDIKALVVGIEHRLTQVEHEITWWTAPGDFYTSAVVADGVSRVQTDNLYLNANIATTGATSITVKSLDGNLLSTTAEPYDITIGGEQMTVTNCVGASSPQTLTVTRSVNGVVKTHTADNSENARVRIYSRPRVALG